MAVICMVMRSVVGGATRPYPESCGTALCCTVQEIYCLSTGQRCAAATSPTASTLTVLDCNEEREVSTLPPTRRPKPFQLTTAPQPALPLPLPYSS